MNGARTVAPVLLMVVYFLPWIVCEIRQARRSLVIFLVNVLLGWTVIGWIGALIWAILEERERFF